MLFLQDKWTPLMYAVKKGHIDVVKVMLETKSVNVLASSKVSLSSVVLYKTNYIECPLKCICRKVRLCCILQHV